MRFSPTDSPSQWARKLNIMGRALAPGGVPVAPESGVAVGTGPGLDRIGNEIRLNIAELPIAPEN